MMERARWKKGLLSLAGIVVILFIWEAVTKLLHIESWLLPSPTAIVQAGMEDWERILGHLISTVQLILTGFIVGSAIGCLLAATLHRVPFAQTVVYPLLVLSQNIPIIVLAPLLVVWFGFGLLPKVIVITLVCFFPIAVSFMNGLKEAPVEQKHYFEMMGADSGQLFWKLELPHALPFLFSGLKISATYSVMGAVISEWLGAQKGLGVYMTVASSSYRTDRIFVAIVIIMAMSLLFFTVISMIEKRLIFWKERRGQSVYVEH